MKKKTLKLKTILLFLLVVFLLFSVTFKDYFFSHRENNYGSEKSRIELKLKKAGHWVIIGSPIYIDDSDPSFNWTITEQTQPWCNLINGVYVIENVTVDGLYSGNAIEIYNSNVSFIIRNNTFLNADYSNMVLLSNVNNSIIFNNTMKNGDYVGLRLLNSNNNTISNNIIKNISSTGIVLSESNNNTITRNIIKNISSTGIVLSESNHNRIFENRVNSNGNRGISINYESNYNNISNNIVNNNSGNGIFIQNGDHNQILENIFSDNGFCGISLGNSDYTVVVGNNIERNHEYGIFIVNSGSDRNTLYMNTVKENHFVNVRDDGFYNQWDNGAIGNYWDDYGGVDANDDGIGDTPYNIPGSADSIDNFPIWDDGLEPSVSLTPPGNFILSSNVGSPDTDGIFNLNWTSASGAVNYSVYEYSAYITVINSSLTLLTNETTVLTFPLTDYSNGTYYFIIVAHNLYGNTSSNCINITVVIPPSPPGSPGSLQLSSTAGTPDNDGNFTLTWTSASRANNYSIYRYSSNITSINGSLTLLIGETDLLLLPINGYSNGTYYFIALAFNDYGNRTSNCIEVEIEIPIDEPEEFPLAIIIIVIISIVGGIGITAVTAVLLRKRKRIST